MQTSDELRSSFLSFFESKGHLIVPSSSLVPKGDPTLLLTSAGMVQFKPYFLGELVPPNPRLTSCQKCFRTTDIESVGDATHLTFFEMLGNFSIGDYFKKEAIAWAWEYVVERLKLPLDRLWFTVYLDDDDAFDYWRRLGAPESRILRFGEATNFWGPAGDSGPCGPSSEIHYDFGEDMKCDREACLPGCDCGRYSEIWNLVFTQYNQGKSGRRTPLPKPNIDTGMGLERVAAIMQGKRSVYETDVFASLMAKVSQLSGKKYSSDGRTALAMRVVAEHSRGIAFLIGDGVLPGNEGRGYVLRRLLRKAALFGRRLGLDKPFLSELIPVTISQMGHVYPELNQRRDFIIRVASLEESKFGETLSTGLELLEGIINDSASRGKKEIAGKEAFRLYDTYGFPVELTREVAAGRGFSVDMPGFEKEIAQQRERARASQKFGLVEGAKLKEKLDIKSTFTGYESLRQQSRVLAIIVDGDSVASIEPGQTAGIILEDTPFYGEMGGQVGDTGEILADGGRFTVTNTVHLQPDVIMHEGSLAEGALSVGDEVEAVVDVERRLDIARNHTATHLLQAALRQVVGEHIQQRGSLVAPERLRFDFSHPAALAPAELEKVQAIVNDRIRRNIVVFSEELPYRVAISQGATALFDEKYGETVRVLKVGKPPISAELCGGTHVNATGEIGYFQIISEGSIGAGLRRIEAVTGRGAEKYINGLIADIRQVAVSLETEPEKVVEKAGALAAELKNARRQVENLERELAGKTAETLLEKVETIKGVTVLAARVPPTRVQVLREMNDMLRERLKSGIIVLGTVFDGRPLFLAAVTPDLVSKGYDAGKIVRRVAEVTGGGGGGKPALAQAGGKEPEKLDEALKLVRELV